MLPNLFIIGAAKCGTSSLHHYLDQHPSISMSSDKEPNVFSSPAWRDGIKRYDDLLDPLKPIRGESSTNYTKHPAFPDVPGRIAELIPDAKLIYVVGEPLARCVKHYAQNLTAGIESRSLNEALADVEDPRNTYVWCGRYATQLERYLEYFPASSVLVLDQGELLNERQAALRRAFRFLEVDEDFHSPRFEEMLNTRTAQRRLTATGSRLRESRPADLYRRLPNRLRAPVTAWTHRVLSRQVPRPELDAGLREELAALYAEELERFAALTGHRVAVAP